MAINYSYLWVWPVFFQSGCLAEAMESHEMAGNWRMTFALSAQLGHGSGEQIQLARRMAGETSSTSY